MFELIYSNLDELASICGACFILVYFIMLFKLKMWGVYSFTEMRHNPLWPLIIARYRDVTREKYGRTGALYYLLFSFLSLAVLALIVEFFIWVLF